MIFSRYFILKKFRELAGQWPTQASEGLETPSASEGGYLRPKEAVTTRHQIQFELGKKSGRFCNDDYFFTTVFRFCHVPRGL